MITRARPLLGTIVSIRAEASNEAVSDAFAAVERVHRLMSAHAEDSELARINRNANHEPIRVHAWTFAVLSCALEMSRVSGGAFDVTQGHGRASYADIELLSGRKIWLRKPTRLDLGGIAKGFAVDRAVEVLRRHGARAASVNAGGDLRIFGETPRQIRVRLPGAPHLVLPLDAASERAFATSASYFGSRLWDARARRQCTTDSSITVSAPSCMVADALTKVVATLGPRRDLLGQFDAHAFLVDREGNLYEASR
jgi:thiamine biosynthesis lipoprotein